MDINKWVADLRERLDRDGQKRLAGLIRDFNYALNNDGHDRVRAMLSEAVALARGADLPWLEVYFRHWNLRKLPDQQRLHGEPVLVEALREAVSLLEFSHRPETMECPQSVCVVEDLVECHENIDGPGYAQERIAVCAETLARINPHWHCFVCISWHMAAALADAGEAHEAKRFLDQQTARLHGAGKERPHALWLRHMDVLLRLGEVDAALDLMGDAQEDHALSKGERLERAVAQARTLARLGRTREALEILPSFFDIVYARFLYPAWTDAIRELIKRGAWSSDAVWSAMLRAMAGHLLHQGAYRHAYDLLLDALAGALERGRSAVAAVDLQSAEKAALKLRRPEEESPRLAELRAQVAAAQAMSIGEGDDTPDALLGALDAERTAERAIAQKTAERAIAQKFEELELALERVAAGRRRWPEHTGLALREAECLVEFGWLWTPVAVERLLVLRAKEPGNTEILKSLGKIYLEEKQNDEALALAEAARVIAPAFAQTMLAKIAYAQGRDAECLEHVAQILGAEPDLVDAHKLGAQAARRLGDFRTMKNRLIKLIALEPKEQQHHWDCMIAATIEGDWDRVRRSAASVGLTVEGAGPIDLEAEPVRIRFTDEEGGFYVRDAVRNGPVTARIIEASTGLPNRFRDVVVFDPRPLDRPEDTSEGQREVHHYAFVATLTRGQ